MKAILITALLFLSSCACKQIDDDPLYLRHDKKEELKAKIEVVCRSRS